MVKVVDENGSRTLGSAAATTGWVGATPIVAVSVMCYGLASYMDSPAPFLWWPSWGAQLLGEYPWFIALSITATVAFLAADFGGQLVRGNNPATTSSRRAQSALIGAALSLWAFTPIIVMLIVVYVAMHAEEAAVLLTVIPTAALQFFLTARVGTLLIPNLDREIGAAKYEQRIAREAVDTWPSRSTRPVWLTLLLNIVILAVAASIAMSPYWEEPLHPFLAAGVFAVVALFAVAVVFGLQVVALASLDWSSRWSVRIFVAAIFAPWIAFLGGAFRASDEGSLRLALGLVLLIYSVVIVTGTLSPRVFPPWLVNWTLTGAASRAAHRWALRRARKRAREFARLQDVISRNQDTARTDNELQDAKVAAVAPLPKSRRRPW